MKLSRLRSGKLKHLRWVGYVALYLLAFIVFAYISFPYDRLRHYVVSTYNASQTGPGTNRLEIDDLSWSWRFPGVVADGVRLVIPAPPARDGEKQAPPRYLEAEELFVSASPLALLMGSREASFGARALDGQVEGWASDSDSGRHLELTLEGINPGGIPQLAELIGLPLAGSLSGNVSVEIPENNVVKAEGTVDLAAEDLVLGDGKAKIQNTIALPELHMGAFTLKAQISGGRLRVEECVARGRDLDLTMTGSVRLRPRVEASLADLELKFSFAEKYRTQSDLTKALFGQPDSKIPGLFDTATSSHLSKQEDGTYGARLVGPVARLTPRPLAGGRRSKDSSATSRRRASRASRRAAAAPAAEAAEAEAGEDGAP